MKLLPLLLAFVPLLSLSAADPATQLTDRGKLVFSDDLTSWDKAAWPALKGKWGIVDGSLQGEQVAADHHAGVTRHPEDMKDVVVQYDFKLEGAQMTTLSFNGKGHVCRVLINPKGFSARKDDSDHDGPDKAVPFGQQTLNCNDGAWHTVVAEIVGDTLVATVDGTKPICGSNPAIAQVKKSVGFTVIGQSVAFRNVRVWEATPKKDFDALKAQLIAATPKPLPGKAPAAKAEN